MRSVSERTMVKPVGAAIRVIIAISEPARPAQAALTTKQPTRLRPRSMPASCAATGSSRTARQRRPTRDSPRLRRSRKVITRQPTARVAIHCVVPVSVPVRKKRPSSTSFGTSGLLTRSPGSPPSVPRKCVAREGMATASARVAPATYGPCSRAAASPTTRPMTTETITAATRRTSTEVSRPSCSRSAVV